MKKNGENEGLAAKEKMEWTRKNVKMVWGGENVSKASQEEPSTRVCQAN